MLTKYGQPAPADLCAAVQATPEGEAQWNAAKPSCQDRYIREIESAADATMRARRVAGVMRRLASFYERRAFAR